VYWRSYIELSKITSQDVDSTIGKRQGHIGLLLNILRYLIDTGERHASETKYAGNIKHEILMTEYLNCNLAVRDLNSTLVFTLLTLSILFMPLVEVNRNSSIIGCLARS
jgi:hypothetical protein